MEDGIGKFVDFDTKHEQKCQSDVTFHDSFLVFRHDNYRANDSQVGDTTAYATKSSGAYLLFYKRKKGKSIWGGMDKILKHKFTPRQEQVDADGFTMVTRKTRSSTSRYN
jgi:hypothetical protein